MDDRAEAEISLRGAEYVRSGMIWYRREEDGGFTEVDFDTRMELHWWECVRRWGVPPPEGESE